MPTLGKPSIPPMQVAAQRNFGNAVRDVRTYLAALVVYLQQYLTRVYQAIVPLQLPGSIITTSPYSVQNSDVYLAAQAGVIDLPAAAGTFRALSVQLITAGSVSLVPNGMDTINDANAAVAISTQYAVIRLIDYAAGKWGNW